MRWSIGNRSSNLEDLRGRRAFGGLGFGRLGIGGIVMLLVLSLIFKKDFFSLVSGGEAATVGEVASTPEEERLVDFVSFVLDTAQSTWSRILEQRGQSYQEARLVLFRDAVQSACGFAQSATGPFYCPGDSRIYIDLGFYEELRSRFGAPGDFAQAYVLAHEVGHHTCDGPLLQRVDLSRHGQQRVRDRWQVHAAAAAALRKRRRRRQHRDEQHQPDVLDRPLTVRARQGLHQPRMYTSQQLVPHSAPGRSRPGGPEARRPAVERSTTRLGGSA